MVELFCENSQISNQQFSNKTIQQFLNVTIQRNHTTKTN